jgi:hypothetical protein
MATIATLIVDIEANTSKLVKDVEGIQGSLDKVGSMASKMGTALAGAFSIGAITSAAKAFVDTASTLTDLSQKTGVSTTELQKLKFAAEQNGGSLEMVTNGISKMGKALIEGNSGTVAAVSRLGLSLTDLRQMDPAQAFGLISDAIAKVPNPLERSKLAMDLFGKAGAELLPTMTGNMTATMQAAEKLGIVIDEKTVAAGDNLGDSFTALQGVGMGVLGKLMAPMLPALQMVADAMMGAGKVVDYLRDMFDALVRVGLLAVKGLVDGAIKVGELASKVPGLSKVLGEDAGAMQAMRDASTWLGGAIKGVEQGTDSAAASVRAAHAPVALLTEDQKNAAKAAEAHAKAIQSLTEKLSGQGAIKAATDMVEALRKAPPIQKLTADAQAEINKTMTAALEVYKAQGLVAPKVLGDIYEATVKLPPVVSAVSGLMKDVGENVKLTIPPFDQFAGMLPKVTDGVGNILGEMLKFTIVPPMFKKATDTVGDLAKSLSQLAQIAGASFGAIVRDISTVVASFDTARKSQKTFADGQKELSDPGGSKLSGILGMSSGILGMATAAISAGKAVGDLIKHIFNLGSAGRDAVKDFAASFGGFDDLHARLLTLGEAGEQLWIKLTQGVGKNNPEQAKAVIDQINAALAGQDAYMQRLPGLIEKYGLSWADAGAQAKQAHLDDIARGLIQDFADLTKAGFDVTTITEHMSDAVNDYVHQAMLTGTEIPAAMKPLLQKMIDMGTLTDAAGDKLADLSGLTFAETLTEGFKSIVDAINTLTKALTGDLPSALDALGRHPVVIPYHFENTGGDPTNPAPAATGGLVTSRTVLPFARGGWVPRGTDTVPAMLTPGEIVMNAAHQRNVAGALMGGDSSGVERRLDGLRSDMSRFMRDQRRALQVAVSDAVALSGRRR